MVPSADLVSHLHKLFILINTQALQHGSTDQGMLLHFLKLFICQSAWFIQNLLVDSHFTNIVKGRCNCDHVLVRPF